MLPRLCSFLIAVAGLFTAGIAGGCGDNDNPRSASPRATHIVVTPSPVPATSDFQVSFRLHGSVPTRRKIGVFITSSAKGRCNAPASRLLDVQRGAAEPVPYTVQFRRRDTPLGNWPWCVGPNQIIVSLMIKTSVGGYSSTRRLGEVSVVVAR